MSFTAGTSWLHRLRERGVIRVAASYAVIGWLLLQIADVTFEPLGVPRWAMVSLIVAAVLGFPVAVALAWFRSPPPIVRLPWGRRSRAGERS